MEFKPIARSADLVVQEAGDEVLVYDLRTNKASCLNETSAAIWRLCDGKRGMVDISIELSAAFKTNVSEELIWLAFDQLEKENLLETDGSSMILDRVSRRQMIKKVGFAAVVAVPIVSSVVAPLAVNAQSSQICDVGSSLACECDSAMGNGTPSCVDAYNSAGYTSTRAGQVGDPCTTQDISCVNVSSGKCEFPAFPGQNKCCDVLEAPACGGGPCCTL